jgi:hypothetical protein
LQPVWFDGPADVTCALALGLQISDRPEVRWLKRILL